MEVSNQIKKHRIINGWSQETLAEKAYVSRQTARAE
jgi:DNA-binding XRE family transcriptional regulator